MESKCILVEGITDMNLEIKQTIGERPIGICGDGKYDKNKSIINLSKIVEIVKNEWKIDYFYCRVIKKHHIHKNEKETNFRLCLLSELEKRNATILLYNNLKIYFSYKVFSIEIQKIIVNIEGKQLISINKDNLIKNKDNCYKLDIKCPLNYIKESEASFSLQFKIISNEDVSDFKEYKVYLSPNDIENHNIVLLNSEIIIKDSCFTQLTTQIFTCAFIDQNIINLIYDYKIKYILFDKKDVKHQTFFMEKLNKGNNRSYEIISFVLALDTKNNSSFKQKIAFFVKDKIDNLLIYNYYSFVFLKNFDIKSQCEYLNIISTNKEEEKEYEKVE